jgi:phosphoenolpyruvate synthase/pyruvate phosphate dikinase
MTKNMATLNDITIGDVLEFGGKAANLGDMIAAGITVPIGFAVACSTDVVENADKILALYDKMGLERVAVRSSAVQEDGKDAACAGQLESYLNVGRSDLVESIIKCKHSITTDRAIAYGLQNNIESNANSVAVVVQQMVDSEKSGVVFTANPITSDRSQMVIEAIYGLGELLVSGQTIPATYIWDTVNKKQILAQQSKQANKLVYSGGHNKLVDLGELDKNTDVLSQKEINKLADACLLVQQHFGSPQDIEWAMTDGQIYIVQSRPITTL